MTKLDPDLCVKLSASVVSRIGIFVLFNHFQLFIS